MLYLKTIFLIFFYVPCGLSIRCYECNSVNNSMCLNPHLYDPETLHQFLPVADCRSGLQAIAPEGDFHFFCRKIEQTILHKHYAPDVRVTRGCGWKRHYKECYKADNEDHLETVCQCFTDQCNTAPGTSIYPIAVILGLFISIFWYN